MHPLRPAPGYKDQGSGQRELGSVAKKHDVTAKELIANNCGLNITPEEINWYLHWRVGCNYARPRLDFELRQSRLHLRPRPGHGPDR